MLRYLLIGLFALLTSCATNGFVRDGATYKDFYSDLRQCEAETQPKWRFCHGHACKQQNAELRKRRNQCMMARGWTLSDDEAAFRP